MLGMLPRYTSSGYLACTSYLATYVIVDKLVSAKVLELQLEFESLSKALQFR